MSWIGPQFEQQGPWSIKRSIDDKLVFARRFVLQVFRQSIPRGFASRLLNELGNLSSRFWSRQGHGHLHLGFSSMRGEYDRDSKQRRPIVGGAVVVNQLSTRFDFEISRRVRIVGAVRAVHGVRPVAAHPQFLTVGRDRKAPRSPPLRDL